MIRIEAVTTEGRHALLALRTFVAPAPPLKVGNHGDNAVETGVGALEAQGVRSPAFRLARNMFEAPPQAAGWTEFTLPLDSAYDTGYLLREGERLVIRINATRGTGRGPAGPAWENAYDNVTGVVKGMPAPEGFEEEDKLAKDLALALLGPYRETGRNLDVLVGVSNPESYFRYAQHGARSWLDVRYVT